MENRLTLEELCCRVGNLPAAGIAGSVNQALAEHACVVVTAPPGAGKSTLLPLTIWAGLSDGGKVLMLEPRRLAARQIAERMADMVGEPVGQTVGYRVRFEKRVSAVTRIEVLTEGILTRMLVDDAVLDGVSVVIFDEFHERSIHSDLALALARHTQQLLRPDLKLVVMSATIDAHDICEQLRAPLVESEGRMFPVEIVRSVYDVERFDLPQATAAAIVKACRAHEGDVLAFLPGQAEIQKCADLLGRSGGFADDAMQRGWEGERMVVCPLYGALSPEQQRRAIAPSRAGERKVVLATPIAETSLTIEGVRVVVDSGYFRTLVFDGRTGLSHLETVRISLDMAAQRMGRAGRVAEGVCYRLWTQALEHRMAERRVPELLEADLAPMLLEVLAFGERDADVLPWLTPPPKGHLAQARHLLRVLGAIDREGQLTSVGRQMAALPCHPRISRMILRAKTRAMKALACDIAALLEEKDPQTAVERARAAEAATDMTFRISQLRQKRREHMLGRWARMAQVAQEYRRMVQVEEDNMDVASEEVGALVAYAYPERIAVAQNHAGLFRLSSGDMVQLDGADSLQVYQWLAVASLHVAGGVGRVFLAAPVCVDDLEELTTEYDRLAWDGKQGCVLMQRERRIGALVISSTSSRCADREQVVRLICEAVKKDGLSMFDWNERVTQLQRRVAQVALWHPDLGIPDLSTPHLMATASEWLPFYLEQGGKVRTTVGDLKRIDLQQVLWAIIPYELQKEIDRIAPTHIMLPTGSHIRVDYRLGAQAPVLSVRLQECFGLADTPRVNNGRQPVLMELLSPGFKPVQLTQDLRSFWQTTYFEVRKELKRRYPKHFWPENPLEAPAVRGVRRMS